ncbi:MAG: methyltransferase domain-containing protein [Caldilineales bacterium]|nr:methyltransferase domain-containing protein [Caldilineales bacterium]
MTKNNTNNANIESVTKPGVDVVAAFTEMAANYEQTVDGELRSFLGIGYQEFVNRFLEKANLQPGEKVLDVATGTAKIPLTVASSLGEQGRIVGLDITPEMLKYARGNLAQSGAGKQTDLVGASALEMPFRPGVFDIVICGLATHHMHVPTMLAQMRRALRPGGRILLADIAATPFWRGLIGKGLLRVLMWHYGLTNDTARGRSELEAVVNLRTVDEWRQLVSHNQFTHIQILELPARHKWYPSAVIIQGIAT